MNSVKDHDLKEAYAAKDIAHSLRSYIESGDTSEEQNLINKLNERPTFLQRFFPSQGASTVQRITVETLQQLRKNKAEIMNAHHAMRLEATRIQADALIQGLGIHVHKDLASFVTRKIEDLTRELSESKERTLDRLMKNYADAELKYKSNQKVYDAAMKSVDKDMAICMQAAENLLDGAISALKNRAGIK